MKTASLLHTRVHGGPDQAGVPLHDFSTNSNACGPSPHALAAVSQADPTRYPDAAYTELRRQLAGFHQVDDDRIVLAASASEFIFRITSLVAQRGGKSLSLPAHRYGDYAQAAGAFAIEPVGVSANADLSWSCDPSSPQGLADERLQGLVNAQTVGEVVVLDRAYEPLRLEGAVQLSDELLKKTWQLWTPNKALGLTGIRAAYAIAPAGDDDGIRAMERLCPSWPVGSHGVAMLQAWVQPEVQSWLHVSKTTLRLWKIRQLDLCARLGWRCDASHANFFCARPALPDGVLLADALVRLRTHGIKLRDTTSFGLPGMVRVSVQSPESQDALHNAWQSVIGKTE
ncbi:MAG: aminotransferase class I/II-fold pyridoxal phosphate-dependent enzyme [Pseudomonadota bacterium]